MKQETILDSILLGTILLLVLLTGNLDYLERGDTKKEKDLQVWKVLCVDRKEVYISAERWSLEKEADLCNHIIGGYKKCQK